MLPALLLRFCGDAGVGSGPGRGLTSESADAVPGCPANDPLDAISAARAAQSGWAAGAPKGRDGQVEAIRALMATGRTARSERIQTTGQARALIVTGPEVLRSRFARHAADDLAAEPAALRPRPGSVIRYHNLLSLRELGRRVAVPGGQLQRLDELIVPAVTARAPGLLASTALATTSPPSS